VIVSGKGWVRARQGHGHDAAQFTFKSGDSFYGTYEVMTSDTLFAIATNGRVYSIAVAGLPSARGDGVPITSLVEVEPGARIDHAFAAATGTSILLAGAGGNGLVCQAGDWLNRMKAGKSFFALEEGDLPLRPSLFTAGVGTTVVCLSDGSGGGYRGRLLSFDVGDVKTLKNGGRGVTLMALDAKETLRQAIVCGRDGLVVRGQGNREKSMERTMTIREIGTHAGTRGRKGKLLEPKWRDVILELPSS
jgi:topoisomerase-4 subunit A